MANEPFKSILGPVSAYLDAKEHGYTGTREEFGEQLANAGTYFQRAEEAAEQAEGYARTASDAAQQTGDDARTASQAADTATDAADNASRDAQAANDAADTASDAADTATQKAEDAELASSNAGQYASNADQSAQEAKGYLDTVKVSATAAAQSASAASESEANAAASERHAQALVDTLPDDYTDMLEDVSGLNETKDIRTVSGDLVSFDSSYADMPLKKLTVDIEPVQDLHGYDHPWPAGGGKNLLAPWITTQTLRGVTWTANSDGTVKSSGTANNSSQPLTHITLPAGSYVLSGCPSGGTTNTYYLRVLGYVDSSITINKSDYGSGVSFEITGNETDIQIFVSVNDGTTAPSGLWKPMIRSASVSDGTYAPYENICPITGWTGANVFASGKNLWGGEKMADDFVSAINNVSTCYKGSDSNGNYVAIVAGSVITNGIGIPSIKQYKENTAYTFVLKARKGNTNNSMNLYVEYTDGSRDVIEFPSTPVVGTVYTFAKTTNPNKTIKSVTAYWGSGTAFLYYDSCGLFEGVVTADDFEPYQGETYNITFPSEAGTVYGGKLEINEDGSGTLTVDRGIIVDDGSEPWAFQNNAFVRYAPLYAKRSNNTSSDAYVIADRFKSGGVNYRDNCGDGNIIKVVGDNNQIACYSSAFSSVDEFNASLAQNPMTIVYMLRDTAKYTLNAQEITTLLGQNNIWADTGDTEVQYGAYISTIKNELGETVPKLMIAPIEKTTTASKPYTVNEFLIIGDKLYIVTANIASGGTITIGTNVSETTIGAQITALLNA